MRGIAAIIATAFFVLAYSGFVLHAADAQVNNGSLEGTVCTVEGNDYASNASMKPTCGTNVLPGATVHIVYGGPLGNGVGGADKTTTTNEKGHYAFSGLPDATYSATIDRTGFAQGTLSVAVKGASSQDFMLDGLKVTGTGLLLAPDGSAVSGVYVSVCCAPTTDGNNGASTGSDGSFKYSTIAGYRTFSANAPGYPQLDQMMLVDGGKVALKLKSMPDQDAAITGHVTDQDGKAVAGIEVFVYNNGGCCGACCMDYDYACVQPADGGSGKPTAPCAMPVYYGGSNQTKTDAAGRYFMHVYGGSSLSIQVNAEGYAPFSAYQYIEKGQTATLDMQIMKYPDKTAHITGHVTDLETGKGLRLVSINIQSPQFGIYECSTDGTDGGAPGYASATESQPTMRNGGIAAQPYPYPNPGCAITVHDDGSFDGMVTPGYALVSANYEQWKSCATTTNADHSSATVCGPEYFGWTGSYNLTANGDSVLNIALKPKPHPDATVSGYLVDGKTHRAIKGAQISFWNQDNGAGGYAQTDADGSYKVGLRSGYHQVNVYLDGYFPWQGVLDVPTGDLAFDVILTPGHAQYGGGCYNCRMYASDGSAMPPQMGAPSGNSGTTTSAPATGPAGSTQTGGGSGGALFEDLHGGLGPYDAQKRAQATAAGGAGKASPHLEVIAVIGVLGLLAMMRRRLPK